MIKEEEFKLNLNQIFGKYNNNNNKAMELLKYYLLRNGENVKKTYKKVTIKLNKNSLKKSLAV